MSQLHDEPMAVLPVAVDQQLDDLEVHNVYIHKTNGDVL